MPAMTPRRANIVRRTRETEIDLALVLDGSSQVTVATGIGFLDHMFTALAFHAGFDFDLTCRGDIEVDDHHTAEDCALALGEAINEALGDRAGITRFGTACAPLDDALARAVVDISGRPFARVDLGLVRPMIGALATENVSHVLVSLATAARLTLHVDMLAGVNDHHRAEAAFKATALALRAAVALSGRTGIPSTKGTL